MAPIAADEHIDGYDDENTFSHEDLPGGSPERQEEDEEVRGSHRHETPEQRWAYELEGGENGEQKAGAALALGRLAAAEGKLTDAIVLLRQAAEFNEPTISPRALVRLVPLFEQLGRKTEAEQALLGATAASDAEHTPDVGLDVAAIFVRRGQQERAIAVLRSVVEAWPERDRDREASDDDGDLPRAVAALRLGNLLAASGETAAAVEPWRQALAANYPAVTPLAALRLGDARARTDEAGEEKPAEIEELYRIAIDFNHPVASPQAGLKLAEHYIAQEQPKLAIQEYLALTCVAGEIGRQAEAGLARLRSDSSSTPNPIFKAIDGLQQRSHRPLLARRDLIPVLIVGAGTGGKYLLNDLDDEPRYRVLGLIDDDQADARVGGIPVLGGIGDLPRIIGEKKPKQIFIAIPTMSGQRRGLVVDAARAHGVEVLNLPSPFEMVRIRNLFRQLRPVRVEETMGKQEMRIDRAAGSLVRGINVMVVGAGASLGSELCRQAAHARARSLSVVSTSDTALRRALDELHRDRRFEQVYTVLGACDHGETMKRALHLHRPDVVFHVGGLGQGRVVEENPVEAIRTDVVGTSQFARLCGEQGVKHFVFLSSEAAAERRGVFGASKALAEYALAEASEEYPGTSYVTVRVGNLFRSSGSVVELFEHQIDLGGPVTVTEARARRRFMRVELAAQLILRTAGKVPLAPLYALSGGEEVLIKDLAERMIRLRGSEPGEIPISYVGPRRIEREMRPPCGAHESLCPTDIEGVSEVVGPEPPPGEVGAVLEQVRAAVEAGDHMNLLALVNGEVSEFLSRAWPQPRLGGSESAELRAV